MSGMQNPQPVARLQDAPLRTGGTHSALEVMLLMAVVPTKTGTTGGSLAPVTSDNGGRQRADADHRNAQADLHQHSCRT